jgi:hypothetical protein
MTEAAAALLAVKKTDDLLRLLQPHLRQVIAYADPALLDTFDGVYEDGTTDAVDEILRGRAEADALSGEQSLGLGGKIAANLLAFLINVAASVAVARCEANHPDVWIWLTRWPAVSTDMTNSADAAERLFARSGLSPVDQARIVKQFHTNPELMQILNSAKVP